MHTNSATTKKLSPAAQGSHSIWMTTGITWIAMMLDRPCSYNSLARCFKKIHCHASGISLTPLSSILTKFRLEVNNIIAYLAIIKK
jgi:hypothetical protein